MILGIGTDIIEIKRIEAAVKKETFLKKVFTSKEIDVFKNNISSLSGNFAAKEAVAKAFGTGFSSFGAKDIEILRDAKGAPFVNLYGDALSFYVKNNVKKIHISISHIKSIATAYVVIEI